MWIVTTPAAAGTTRAPKADAVPAATVSGIETTSRGRTRTARSGEDTPA
jgi:hypothetical protein